MLTAGRGHFYCGARADQQSDRKNTRIKHNNAGGDKGKEEGTSVTGAVATKLRTIACKLRGLSTMDGLRTVRLRNEDFFIQSNFVSGVCAHT